MADRSDATIVLPAEQAEPCAHCGARQVAVWRDGIGPLMDNMGCELGLELVAGPLCPACDAGELARLGARERRGGN